MLLLFKIIIKNKTKAKMNDLLFYSISYTNNNKHLKKKQKKRADTTPWHRRIITHIAMITHTKKSFREQEESNQKFIQLHKF